MTAVILGAGDFPRTEYPRYLLRTAGLVVCCDGAFRKYRAFAGAALGQIPFVVIGDMDSLPRGLREAYRDHVISLPGQDDNDQTKALRHILKHYPEVDTIHILGATGRREDHTLGNLGLLMEYARTYLGGLSPDEPVSPLGAGPVPDGKTAPDVRIDLVSDYGTAVALTDSCELWVGEGRSVSLFSPDPTLTIRSEGLRWPTEGVVWDNWWKGTLNRATADRIRLTFSHPSVALIILS